MSVESFTEHAWIEELTTPWISEYEAGPEPSLRVPAGDDWTAYIAPYSSYDEADGAGGEPEPWLEQQSVPPDSPTVTTSFSAEALAELPDILRAKPLAELTATVPTEQVLWMISIGLRTVGAEPGWADGLLVDLAELPKAGPSSKVHVTVIQTVPFGRNETDKLTAFHRFARVQHPTPVPPIDVLVVTAYPAHRTVEEKFGWPPASIATASGLPSVMTVDQAANYKILVYAVLPQTAGRVVAPRDQRHLRGFPFARATLTADHEHALAWLAREIVRSWHSRKRVARIVVQGHTDPVGTREYNDALGRRRAEAVVSRLKQLVNEAAGTLPAGTVESIAYVVESYGEDRPFSRRVQALNRRVEITLYRDWTPPPAPLDVDVTVNRLDGLVRQPSGLPSNTVTRLQCLLQKVRGPGSDDRYANETQVFLINRDNEMPRPETWSRVRNLVLDPGLFGPQVEDQQAVANLARVDEDIIGGVAKMNQIIAYASGPDHGLGLLALANAFKQFNVWVLERLKDPTSVYACYPDLRP
jgi:outer membrane protein OmpA-like peptidoglycan-associated protein